MCEYRHVALRVVLSSDTDDSVKDVGGEDDIKCRGSWRSRRSLVFFIGSFALKLYAPRCRRSADS